MATTLKGKAGNDTLTGGDDMIIGFGSSSLTVDELPNVDSSATTAKVTLNADTTSYTASTSMLTIDGGLVSGAIEIVGNAKANKIFAGDFGSTLNGGGGKDSLWGGDGSDTFIYSSGGGNDVIYNFGNEDALQIVGTFTASVVGEDVTFKVGSTANAVTLKDFTAEEFIVNGDTYRINGNNFVK